MTALGADDAVQDRLPSALPTTPAQFLSRPRLLDALDAGAQSRVIVLRAPGGSGKSTLLADWLGRRAGDPQPVVWIALDESARSRAGFWHRVILGLLSSGVALADGPLADFVSGFVELARVPSLLLAELSRAPHPLRLILDDFHIVDNTGAEDVAWLIERSDRLQVLVTTRGRTRLEDPAIAVRLDPMVITAAQLAFDLDETIRVLGRSGSALAVEDAPIIRDATGGHPLATRVAIATFDSTRGNPSEPLDREAVIGRIAIHAARELLPMFQEEEHRAVGLRVALATSVDARLAVELTGVHDAERVLRHFERDGLGEFQQEGGETVFSFHPLVGHALEREAERALDADEVADLRRTTARHFAAHGNALGALRLYVRLGEYREMWPAIARNFSDLIVHHQAELEEIIGKVPPARLREEWTLAIVLAIVRSEQVGTPSAGVRQLVDTAHEVLSRTPPETDPLARFWTLLSTFAGFRAARCYHQAAVAGDAVVAHVDRMPPGARAVAGSAIDTGHLQIVITYVLVGRLDDALSLARQLAHDPHPGRQQHRLSLLAYLQVLRGGMPEAQALAGAVTQARVATWRATVPATGWHIAEAVIRLERNDPDGALETISALDSRLGVLEHWPYMLWVKGLARLAGPNPEIGVDELATAIATHRSRSASPFALDLLASLHSDLYLAIGQVARARAALAERPQGSTQIILARARLLLSDGQVDEVKASIAPLLWGEGSTLRQQAEALLLHAVCDLRLGYLEEAVFSARRAFALLDRHEMRLPLVMVPRTELLEVARSVLPEYLHLFDGLPDPFSSVSTPNPLTRREQEVLVTLESPATLGAVAARHFVSVNTIKTQLRSIYRKLGVSSREDAVRVARRRGLFPG